MSKQYDASEKSLNGILSDYSSMYVPPFQRPYKWGEAQLQEFFEDFFKPIDWSRGASSLSKDNDTHYMGAVVLCGDKEGHMILDGQQRLTSITLILAYIKSRLYQCSNSDKPKIKRSLAYDGKLFKQGPRVSDDLVTIIQPQDEDRKIYEQILKSEDLNIPLETDQSGISIAQKKTNRMLRKRPMFKAYKEIRKFVQTYIIKPATDQKIDEFTALDIAASRILTHLSFVVIVAHNESAAYRLFETLNDRGLDLSAADLIKNSLFAIARNDAQRKLVRERWENLTEQIGGELVPFLRTFWLMEHDFVRKDGLFDAYKSDLLEYKNDESYLPNFLEKLVKSAEHFNEISHYETDSDFNSEVEMLNDLGAKTCRPLLLVIKINRPQLLKQVAKIVEALTVRWMVSGKVFNVLETTYAKVAVMVSELIAEGKDDSGMVILIKSELSKLDVPDDDLFSLAFEKYDVARTSRAIRFILCSINNRISKTSEVIADSSRVHIEHIYPQEPSLDAKEESEITDDEAEEYSAKIGNVTLLDAKINMGLKNKSFKSKLNAEKGYKTSRLAINDSLKDKKTWKKSDIDERSKFYASYAVKIWQWS